MEPLGTQPRHWRDCEDSLITNVTDEQLAEYLIGYAIEFVLPRDYWPKDKGEWKISCSDSVVAGDKEVSMGFKCGELLMLGIPVAGPKPKQIGQYLKIPMSGKYSIRQAIVESKPSASLVKDIIVPSVTPPMRHSKIANMALTAIDFFKNGTSQRIQVNSILGSKHAFVAFMSVMQILAMQTEYCFNDSVLPPEPKHQTDARKRPDFQGLIDAEWVEMDTVYSMGTIKFVPVDQVPSNITLSPTKFAYKCKFGASGEVIKKKARICVRGDLQFENEYVETYAPTSRFNTLRTLISVAAQEDLKLMQFDVK